MSESHAQDTLLAHLTNPDSLDFLLTEGFSREDKRSCIPTEAARKVTEWALDYFFDNKRIVAPSKEAILEAWGRDLERVELVINDETEPDSIQGAVVQLLATYAEHQTQVIVREVAKAAHDADVTEKVNVVQDASWRFYELNQAVVSRRNHGTGPDLYADSFDRYLDRKENGNITRGLVFGTGMEKIDQHIHGVHPGEIMVIAGGTGVGKSFMAARAALGMCKLGKKVVYYTLENDTPMTADRLICMNAAASYERYQKGALEPDEEDRMLLVLDTMRKAEQPFDVIMPSDGERTVLDMYRQALVLGAEAMIIDQLTFVDHQSSHREEYLRIKDTMHALKTLCNEGSNQLACVLIHQMNRAGVEAARKSGRIESVHMLGGSEIENTSDHILGIYQSDDMRIAQEAHLQQVKFRRGQRVDWEMRWRLEYGDIAVRREVVAA